MFESHEPIRDLAQQLLAGQSENGYQFVLKNTVLTVDERREVSGRSTPNVAHCRGDRWIGAFVSLVKSDAIPDDVALLQAEIESTLFLESIDG